jgi:hypothetical protein
MNPMDKSGHHPSSLEYEAPKAIEPELPLEDVELEFDEADSLFDERTGVHDGHGRY